MPLTVPEEFLAHWNEKLEGLKPEEIVHWAIMTLPKLYQTTAFGLSGLCIMDMAKSQGVDLVFIDTLYHFPQTLDLIDRIKEKYPDTKLHIYKPKDCETDTDFVAKYGDELWEKDDLKYDYLVKVEPLKRANLELDIGAVFTGRRRSQGAARGSIPIVEYDAAVGMIKVNPLVNWGFNDVKTYIDENSVPYNELLDLGYKSVGDWHSTLPTPADGDERSGRWANNQGKTECGIHQIGKFDEFVT